MSDIIKCPFCQSYVDNTFTITECPKCKASFEGVDIKPSFEPDKPPSFWDEPAFYFYGSAGRSIGGIVLAIILLRLFGLIGVGIILALFYIVRAVVRRVRPKADLPSEEL